MLKSQAQDGAGAPGEGRRVAESQVVLEPRPLGETESPAHLCCPCRQPNLVAMTPGGGGVVDGEGKETVSACCSCRNKVPQGGWLKQWKFAFSQSLTLEVQDQGVSRVGLP